ATQSASAALAIFRRSATDFDDIHATACLRQVALFWTRAQRAEDALGLQVINAWSLAKLQEAQAAIPREFEEALCSAVERRRSEFSARHLATVLWSFAKAPAGRLDTVASLATEVPRLLPDMSAQGLANCFFALASFRSTKALELLASEALRRRPALQPKDLSSLIWSAGTLAARHAALARGLLPESRSRRKEFSTRQLANMAWAFATIDPEAWAEDVQTLVDEAFGRQLPARDLPNLCWALAAIRGSPGPAVAALSPDRLGELSPAVLPGICWALAAVAAPAAAEVLGSAVPHSEDCSASGIARLLWCLAKLQEAAQPVWRTADAVRTASRRVTEFNTLDVRSVAWAAAKLETAAKSLAELLVARVPHAEWPGSCLVQVAWAAARLGVFDTHAAGALSATDPSTLRAQDVALSAWTLATWGYEGSEGGLVQFAAAAAQRAEEFAARDVANVAWAMASQALIDEPAIVALAARAQRTMSEMELQHLCNLLWAFATFSWQRTPGPTMLRGLSAALLRRRPSEFEHRGLAATSWALADALQLPMPPSRR
ncbi:unnamed protein product, partial [Symbiodinium sp. CCMP2456]